MSQLASDSPHHTAYDPSQDFLLVLLSFYGFAAIGMISGVLGVAWLHIQLEFALPLDALGLLLTVMTSARLLGSFYAGSFITRIGVGHFCLLGSILAAVGLLGMALAPSWFVLLGLAWFASLGDAMINVGINTFASHSYRVGTINRLHGFFGLGALLGPLLVTLLVVQGALSWRWSYGVLAALQLLLLLGIALSLPRWHMQHSEQENSKPASARESLRYPMVWLCIALLFSHTGIQAGVGQLSNSLLVESRGINPGLAGTWISIYWTTITLGRLLLGFVVAHLGAVRMMRVSLAGAVLSALLLWWNVHPLGNLAALALMGWMLAPVFPTAFSRTPQLVGKRHSANALGFQVAAASLGAALLPGAITVLAERGGLERIPPSLAFIALLQFAAHEAIVRYDAKLEAKRKLQAR